MSHSEYALMDPKKLITRLSELADNPCINEENTQLYKEFFTWNPLKVLNMNLDLEMNEKLYQKSRKAQEQLGDAFSYYVEIDRLTKWLSLAIRGELCQYSDEDTDWQKYV